MVLLPVVARELRVKARGKAAYRVRFWAVLLMLALLFWFLKFSGESQNAPNFGLDVMVTLSIPAGIFSLLIGVAATADCVSSEKREGTLGLLFLTDLRGYDVICGKLAANSINAIYALVAILPVMSLSVMMGGVTFLQFLKVALTLLGMMVLSLSVGIFVSTSSRNERKAMFFTVLLLLAITFLPVLLPAWYDESVHSLPEKDMWKCLLFCPGFGIPDALDPSAAFPPYAYWLSILWQWLVAAALIVWASARVPHSWDDSGRKKKLPSERKATARSQIRRARGRVWLERNPFLWLALQGEEASQRRVWLFVLAMLAIWLITAFKFGMGMMADEGIAMVCVYLVNTMLKIWVAGEATRRFCEDRNNNTFEFLLSTPLSVRQIIVGQWLALLIQFAVPLGIVLAWEAFLLIFSSGRRYGDAAQPIDYWPKMILLVADSLALAWVGMWFGLKSKSRIRAILGSLTLVLIVPSIITQMIVSVWPATVTTTLGYTQLHSGWRDHQSIIALFAGALPDLAIVIWISSCLPQRFRKLAIRQ